MSALEFLDKMFRCRWRRLCDAHDRQITTPELSRWRTR